MLIMSMHFLSQYILGVQLPVFEHYADGVDSKLKLFPTNFPTFLVLKMNKLEAKIDILMYCFIFNKEN